MGPSFSSWRFSPRGARELSRPAGSHEADRFLQRLKLVLQGCELLAQGGMVDVLDDRVWGMAGRILFNVGVSHLNVEEAFLETTGPKKRT